MISMAVQVMHVGRVRMSMLNRPMLVRMGVGLSGWILGTVCMLMVFVMHMRMRVHHRLVDVLVLVALSDVQPDTQRHERSCREELRGDGLSERNDGGNSPQEGRGREIGSCSRRSQIAERNDEKRQAYAVSQKANNHRKNRRKRWGQQSSGPEAKREIDWSGDKTLELDNLQRIGQRNLTCQIIVEAPRHAGTENRERTYIGLKASRSRP